MSQTLSEDRPKLLYVDDERANLTAFRVLLRDTYHVLTADNAEDAYSLLQEHDIPLVISDQRMPGITGTELLGKIAADFPDSVRMILTGYSDIDAVIDGINRSQIYYYFKKPWDENEVRLTLKNALEYVMTRRRLVESEQRFRSTFEQAGVGIAHLNPNGTFERANPKLQEIFNTSEADLRGQSVTSWLSGISPDELQAIEQGKATLMVRETSIFTSTGNKWGRIALTAIESRKGTVEHLVLAVNDLTERKRAEEELQEVLLFNKQIINCAQEGIVVYDQELRCQLFNPFMEKITGMNAADVIGKTALELFPFKKEIGILDDLHESLMGKQTEPREFKGLIPETVRNGYVVQSNAPLFNNNGEIIGVIGMIRDITDQKRAEEQFMQAQKMEAVGRLAGGIAHDFNNMLGVILGHADLSLMHMEHSDPLFGSLTEIFKAAERSSNLTRQLLAFARKQTIEPKVLDMNETVSGMLKMLQRLIGEGIQLTCHAAADLWLVKIDPSQVDQILANLCVNAKDAIKDTGRITIELQNITINTEQYEITPDSAPGDYVCLSVRDDGCGMDKETQAHIFEPFYTTKELGKGTGLGLATVFGIIRQNNGFIHVQSDLGHGTMFAAYLPRFNEKHLPTHSEDKMQPLQQGHETILLVEDEPAILQLTSTMLTEQGYTVLTAKAAAEAIQLAHEHAGDISLLITDVIMPEMNGRDLAASLHSVYPNMKCLFMSGYTSDVIAHHGVLDEGMQFLQKPFSLKDISKKVRIALEKA